MWDIVLIDVANSCTRLALESLLCAAGEPAVLHVPEREGDVALRKNLALARKKSHSLLVGTRVVLRNEPSPSRTLSNGGDSSI